MSRALRSAASRKRGHTNLLGEDEGADALESAGAAQASEAGVGTTCRSAGGG